MVVVVALRPSPYPHNDDALALNQRWTNKE